MSELGFEGCKDEQDSQLGDGCEGRRSVALKHPAHPSILQILVQTKDEQDSQLGDGCEGRR